MLRINWNQDKVGFVNAFILIGIVAATLITTLVLIILGIVAGDWSQYLLPLKFVLAGAYILCTIAVLVRISVYRIGVLKQRANEQNGSGSDQKKGQEPKG